MIDRFFCQETITEFTNSKYFHSLQLYLQIVDIKNLPSAIPEKSVYVWYTKTKPDAFIRDGGRLDISSKTGKSIGAGFQCEPTGEIILTVMVDQACFGASSSSKKPEPLGKVSISLQEVTGHDSSLSFERWFELKTCGAYAGSPPVSLRVAASCTVPRQAPQVLSMVNVKPCSLRACLLPHSIEDQNMSSWTRFVYDCGTELIRLQIRYSFFRGMNRYIYVRNCTLILDTHLFAD